MTVGLLQIQLRIPNNRSLKGKRRVLSSIKSRLRSRFNVSVAEVDDQDLWQRATLAVACVSTTRSLSHKLLSDVVSAVRSVPDSELLDYSIDLL